MQPPTTAGAPAYTPLVKNMSNKVHLRSKKSNMSHVNGTSMKTTEGHSHQMSLGKPLEEVIQCDVQRACIGSRNGGATATASCTEPRDRPQLPDERSQELQQLKKY